MTLKLIKDGEQSATTDTFEAAVKGAQELLGFHKDVETTYAILGADGKLLAALTNRRITGMFTKQKWGGRKGDDAIHISDVEFDATTHILQMPYAEVIALRDHDETTDDVGRALVPWDGPCYVSLVDSVCWYFGVEAMDEITPEALAFAFERIKHELPRDEVITLSLKVRVRVAPGADTAEFIKSMDCRVASRATGVTVSGIAFEEVPNPS